MSSQSLPRFEPADIDLVRQLKLRKPEAVGQLYDAYGPCLFALIKSVVFVHDLAEALLTEVFLLACNRVHDFPDTAVNLGAWLLILARNHVVQYLRSTTGRGRPALDLETPFLFRTENGLSGFAEIPEIRESLRLAPEQQRAALQLAWCEGRSYREIGDKLGQPPATVKTLISESLAQIQNL